MSRLFLETFDFVEKLRRGEPQTLVLFGTSLSYHLGPPLRDALKLRFGDAVTVINAGLSGKASRTALRELEERVLRHAPDAIWLEFAANDAYSYEEFPDDALDKGITLTQSRAHLETMIERIRAVLPDCEIALHTTNMAYDSGHNSLWCGARRPDLALFYQSYREVAAARHLRLVDATAMWNALRAKDAPLFERLIPDGVHPTPAALREFLVPFLLDRIGA